MLGARLVPVLSFCSKDLRARLHHTSAYAFAPLSPYRCRCAIKESRSFTRPRLATQLRRQSIARRQFKRKKSGKNFFFCYFPPALKKKKDSPSNMKDPPACSKRAR